MEPSLRQSPPARRRVPVAERLGYAAEDRLLIIHADDAGMCHSANAATIRALEAGIVTCASVMVPCPWFPEMAHYAREHSEADLGVHLAMTSEWQGYRWGPVSPADQVPTLLDAEGYFPRGTGEAVQAGAPAEVECEIRAQIERARQFGMRPTHVDSHMGTMFNGRFFEAYVRVAREAGILPMLIRPSESWAERAREMGIDGLELEAAGFLLIDHLCTGASGTTLEERREAYYRVLEGLQPGVSEIIVHLAMEDDEIRHVTGHWEARWHELQIFTDERTRTRIDALGIRLIGYRDLGGLAVGATGTERAAPVDGGASAESTA